MFYFAGSGAKAADKIVLFTPTAFQNFYAMLLGDLRRDGTMDVDEPGGIGNIDFVLSTAAKAITFFLSDYPEAVIMIDAAMPSRTRLFRMAIIRNMKELGEQLGVYGITDGHVEPFQAGETYDRFAVSLRND